MACFENHVYSGFEPLHAFEIVYGGHFEHRLLSPKRATMAHQRLVIDGIRLEMGAYDFPVIARGAMPGGVICIGMVADGIDATRYNTALATNDAIQVYAPGADLMYHATAASRWINFTAPLALLIRLSLERHGRLPDLPEHGILSIPIARDRRLYLQRLAEDAFALALAMQPHEISRELATGMADALAMAYVDALQGAEVDKRSSTAANHRRARVILDCEQIALGAWMFDTDMVNLAHRTGLSLRSLERTFRDGVGMTPGRWFKNMRLNGALRDLLAPAPECSVTKVAMRWGFRHLSRFSGEYMQAFGEMPSQTLNHARRH